MYVLIGCRHESSNLNVFVNRETVDTEVLARNVKIIAESLARQVFNLGSDGQHEILTEGLVSKLSQAPKE